MSSYREVLHSAIERIEQNDLSGETAQILLLELCSMSNTDLYLKYDQEVS